MKAFVRSALTHPWVLPLLYPLTRGAAPVFMLHRFADASSGRPGHDTAVLRGHLGWLRRHGFAILPLVELFSRLDRGEPVYKSVAFTVDDGYADFADHGLPAFAEFDCPVTVFLVTDFLDGRGWLWWDKVERQVHATGRDGVRLDHASGVWTYRWRDARERRAAVLDLIERLKTVPEADRQMLIGQLGAQLEVELAPNPPPECGPLTWDAVRRCVRSGVSFGPHTLTHPILAQTTDAQAATEITGSWRRVREEVPGGATPVFCYPNGDAGSFGARERRLVAEAGLSAAVTTVHGLAGRHLFQRAAADARFALPRMPYVEGGTVFVQSCAGLERAKRALRAAVPSHGA